MSWKLPPTWALELNFPAGSNDWNGQATKLAPSGDLWTPDTFPSAEEWNYLFNQLTTYADVVNKLGMQAAAANWYPKLTNPYTSGTTVAVTCWDNYSAKWLTAAYDPSFPLNEFFESHDGGVSWLNLGGGGPDLTDFAPLAMVSNPDLVVAPTGTIMVDANLDIYYIDVSNGQTHRFSGSHAPAGTTLAALDSFGGSSVNYQLYTIQQSGGTFTGKWQKGPFPTLTDISSSLPSAWQSGTNHVGKLLVCNNTDFDPTFNSGYLELVAICGVTPGTDTARLMSVTASLVATDLAPSFLTNQTIVGITWSPVDQLWGVLSTDGTHGWLTTSPDLATWTVVHKFDHTTVNGLAVVGACWAVSTTVNTNFFANAQRVLYSTTVASGTPTFTPAAVRLPNTLTTLQSNGNQLFAGGPLFSQMSLIGGSVRPSLLAP